MRNTEVRKMVPVPRFEHKQGRERVGTMITLVLEIQLIQLTFVIQFVMHDCVH